MSFRDWGDSKAKMSMSEKVGRILTTMQETACVHIEEREIIAFCKVYKMINPKDEKFNEFLDKVGIPAFTEIGRQRWYRDTITDLGLALSIREAKAEEEDAGNILDVKV